VQALASGAQDIGPAADYARFHDAVAHAQLTQWLAELAPRPELLVDISVPPRAAEVAACAGHSVLRVVEPGPAAGGYGGPAAPPAPGTGGRGDMESRGGMGAAQAPMPGGPGGSPPRTGRAPRGKQSGRLRTVAADGTGLEFLADGCADGVIAENRSLSRRLAAEPLVAEIARVLRPGGQVLACVDSLTLGMAVLAEQHRWPHLMDVPNADVVLVPWPDGTITRCYGAEQLRELFTSSGLEVSWIRPRTVFSPRTVSYLLARDPRSFGKLVMAELRARSDDSVGAQLITCARRC
jgi:SAM-dependent methyltransferase